MTSYIYGASTTTWEIWECGGQALLYDGRDPEMPKQLLAAQWSRVHTFQVAGEGAARQFFKQWITQQVPPIGSPKRVHDYLVDLQVEATQ